MTQRLTTIAVLIPLLGLMALIGRAEFAVRSGPAWRIPIEGFDPRDLLHGQYLQYRFRFNWQGLDTCGATDNALDPGCCLCLTRDNPGGIDPAVREVSCDEAKLDCDGWLHSDHLEGPQRYFVPENQAAGLEDALRHREAALQLSCGPDGSPAIAGLYLDGQPWRNVLGE